MDFNLPEGVTEEQICRQVKAEYTAGLNFVEQKRERFRERVELYANVTNQNDKIYVRLLYAVMNTLMALYYSDEIQINFKGRQLGDEGVAENLQNLAKFDYEEMDLEKKKYQVQRDRLFFGAGIEVSDGWDAVKKVPKTRTIDPLCRIPDPAFDLDFGYRFHGFEMQMSKYEFKAGAGYFGIDDMKTDNQLELDEYVENRMQEGYSFDQIENEKAYRDKRELFQETASIIDGNEVYSVYRHYTIVNGRKYLTERGNHQSLLIRFQEILPVREEEKKDPSNVCFPVVVRNYSPLRGDPFGVSIPDLLEDKQKMQQLFLNLERIKAEHEAWGDVFFYDPDVIKNINDIKIPSQGPKYVSANLSQGQTPMIAKPVEQIKPDVVNTRQAIEQQRQFDTGLDLRSLGVGGQSNITATENQRIQKNANLKLVLGTRIDSRAEKDFWNILRYRQYQQHFKFSDKKNIYLNNGLGQVPYTVNKKDFLSASDIDIQIVSKSEKESQNEKEKAAYMATVNFVLEGQSPAVSKAFALRKLYSLQGIPKEETFALVPESVDEMQAKMDLEMLNRDMDLGSIENMDEDHMTYIIIYQSALETKAKAKAIEKRMQAYVKSGQKQEQAQQAQQQQPGGGQAQASQAQLTSNAMGQANKAENGAESLSSILG